MVRGTDAVVLLLRLWLGGFLVWGVCDNILSTARMAEFQGFLTQLNCPWPALAAPVSVWAQLLIGLLVIPGFLTRWAGLLLAANFAVAVWLIGGAGGGTDVVLRAIFGPMMCVLSGLWLATYGPGRASVDHAMNRRR